MKRLGDVLGASPGTPDETLPCADCKAPMAVSGATIEFAAAMNRVRLSRDIPMVRKSEGLALCPPCYEKHHRALLAASASANERDHALWKQWLSNGLSEEQLIARVSDPGGYRQVVANVKAHRASKNRGGNDSSKRRAVVGDRQ